MNQFVVNKRILVTGACGTVGKELVRQLLSDEVNEPMELLGIDNNESELFFLDQEYLRDSRAHFMVADVRDQEAMNRAMRDVDIVFHAAALKHVVLCERSPDEGVQTNIHGVQNIIAAANLNNVDTVIFTSSDKAVNPTNVMGTTKLMGERLMTAANSSKRNKGPVFASTRFGNVLGSNGSVIPIFHKQIQKGGPVTLTHNEMTRFVMSIEEAVKLVIDSAGMAQGGEVFITKMPVINIQDLAEVMIEQLAPRYGYKVSDIAITEIGTKPGEKLYEELMSHEETRRAVELPQYFSILPAFRGMYKEIPYDYKNIVTDDVTNPYVSADEVILTKGELLDFLVNNKLLQLQEDIHYPDKRYWPGDKEEG